MNQKYFVKLSSEDRSNLEKLVSSGNAPARSVERFEFHFTPKYGSWFNMAEIELGIIIRQCLSRRIATKVKLEAEVKAWQNDRNAKFFKVDWQFTTSDARIK